MQLCSPRCWLVVSLEKKYSYSILSAIETIDARLEITSILCLGYDLKSWPRCQIRSLHSEYMHSLS